MKKADPRLMLIMSMNTVVKTDAQMEKRYDFIDKLFWKKK